MNNNIESTGKWLELLVPWFGYGDLKNADIIFLGNEEGLGGRPNQLDNLLDAKATLLGNNPDCWLEKNRNGGCWEISAREADKKVLAHINRIEGTNIEWKPFTKSEALRFQARMLLSLDNPNGHWFNKKDEALDYFLKILQYVGDELYTPHAKIKSFLMDLRFLPRAKEDYWPFKDIKRDIYSDAFTYDPKKIKDNEIFKGYADPRAKILKKAIEYTPAKVIIGIGDIEAKRNFFEMYFTDEKPLRFSEGKLSTCKIYTANTTISGRQVLIILCPFFDSRGRGHLKLIGLQELTNMLVRPFWENNSIVDRKH